VAVKSEEEDGEGRNRAASVFSLFIVILCIPLPQCFLFLIASTACLPFIFSLLPRGTFADRSFIIIRMYQSMQAACEELRTMDLPGSKDAGRLYRIAMEKKGVFHHGGVPIEYARLQTDTPGPEAWNHGWTR
jgi:hypothetical protein